MTDHPYRDPYLYDLEYGHLSDDIVFYTDLARRWPGPVVELGCGNGRILLPMARAGVTVHGLDSSAHMLEDLAAKVRGEAADVQSRISWHLGDFSTVSGRNRLVLWPFNALHHLPGPDALSLTLAAIRGALRDDGLLALDCFLPDPSVGTVGPLKRGAVRLDRHPVTGEPLRSWQEEWWDASARVHHVVRVWQRADGREERLHNALRMYDLDELHALARHAGFEVHHEAEDFVGAPVSPASLQWVAQMRPR